MARRKTNIYKRNDGRFEARYIKGRRLDGKAIYGSVYAKTYNEVNSKLDNAIKNANNKMKPSILGVVTWFDTYLSSKNNSIKLSTYAVYSCYIENHIKPFFNNMIINDINIDGIQKFIDTKIAEGLSKSTLQNILIFFIASLKEAEKLNYITNIISDKIKVPKGEIKEISVFTLADQKKLESTLDNNNKYHIGILICLYTGIRIGELCGLQWSDIDFFTNTMYVRRTIQRVKNDKGAIKKTKMVIMAPKSEFSKRDIPLPPFLIHILNNFYNLNSYISNDDYVLNNKGKVIEPRTLQYQFKNILKQAGLKNNNFHALRHTFVTRALENKIDIQTISEILGHSSATITLAKYAHSLNEHKRKCMEQLGNIYY